MITLPHTKFKQNDDITTTGTITISSKGDFTEFSTHADNNTKIVGHDAEFLPFQRNAKNSEVNTAIVQCFINYQTAKTNNEPHPTKYLPKGFIVLASGITKGGKLVDYCNMLLIDGKQRLTCQKRAAKILGVDIEVDYNVNFLENASKQRLAKEFVHYNSKNTMSQSELVNAAYHYDNFDRLFDKIDKARELGYLYGVDIVAKPSRVRDSITSKLPSEFKLSLFLNMIHNAIDGKSRTHQMLNRSNDISQSAVNNACLFLSLFQEILGHKSLRYGKDGKKLDLFSCTTFMSAMMKVVLVHDITNPKSKLDVTGLRFFLEFLKDDNVNESFRFYEFLKGNRAGGNTAIEAVHSAFTEVPKSKQKPFGIIYGKGADYKRFFTTSGRAIDHNIDVIDAGSEWYNAHKGTKLKPTAANKKKKVVKKKK